MEFNKYGPRSQAETAAIWMQEILLVCVAAFVVVFATGVIFQGPPQQELNEQARLKITSERTGSLLNDEESKLGQEAN